MTRPLPIVIMLAVLLAGAWLFAPGLAAAQGRLDPFRGLADDDDNDGGGKSNSKKHKDSDDDDDDDDDASKDLFSAILEVAFRVLFLGTAGAPDPWHFNSVPFETEGYVQNFDKDPPFRVQALGILEATFRSQDTDLLGFRTAFQLIGNTHIGGGIDFHYYRERLPDHSQDELWFGHLTWGWQFYPGRNGWLDLGFSLGLIGGAGGRSALGAGFYYKTRAILPGVLNITSYAHTNFYPGGVLFEGDLTIGHMFNLVEVRVGLWWLVASHAKPLIGPTIGVTFWL